MELQFEQLDYQQAAVQAVINLFDGQPNADLAFDLKMLNDVRFIANAALQLSDEQLQQNLTAQQTATQISPSFLAEQGKHFSIEMETGTGKTYVYLRTIFELNRRYGWQKFVIVVPSVAIREGVLHSLTVMKSHFDDLFNKPSVNPAFEYKSQQLNRLRAFATNNVLEILVMNIDAFAKDSNVINTPNESGDAPIRYIQQANPISWRFLISLAVSFSVQIWNTFGLSQPSRKAEWEKINRNGLSSESKLSLSRIIS